MFRAVFLSMFMLSAVTSPLAALSSSSSTSLMRFAMFPVGLWLVASHLVLFRRQQPHWLLGVCNAAAIAASGLSLPQDTQSSISGLTFCAMFHYLLYGTKTQVAVQHLTWCAGVAGAYVVAGRTDQFFIIIPGLLLVSVMQRMILATAMENERAKRRSMDVARVSQALIMARTPAEISNVIVDGVRALLVDTKVRSLEFADPSQLNYHVRRPSEQTLWFEVMGERRSYGALEVRTSRPMGAQIKATIETLAGQAALAFDRCESSERLSTLFAHSADILVVLEEDGTVSSISPAYELITGRSSQSALTKHVRTLLHPQDTGALLVMMETHPPGTSTLSLRWRCADGEWRETEAKLASLAGAGQTGKWALNARDVSDRVALEVELRHAQKLEAVGRLASGVAHEINTPIQFAGSNLHFLRTAFADYKRLLVAYRSAVTDETQLAQLAALEDDLDVEFLEEQIPMAVEQGLDGTDRVARIVKAMKMFGHPDGAEQAPVDLNELIVSTLTVARNEWKYVAVAETDLAELPTVRCFAGDINQVLLNLVVNAAHAIADKGGNENHLGTITVKSRLDGGDVAISISDTGTGIPDDVRERIYDPFFTTKEVGRGTGQGLSLVKSLVVDRHDGRVALDTEVGVGTTFTVYIPVGGRSSAPADSMNVGRSQ
jgi:PAS domain S-box-containing protein